MPSVNVIFAFYNLNTYIFNSLMAQFLINCADLSRSYRQIAYFFRHFTHLLSSAFHEYINLHKICISSGSENFR